MAATVVSGKLVNAKIGDFSTFVVNADYSVDGAVARQTSSPDAGGSYSLTLPGKGAWKGPLTLTANGASGRKLGEVGGLGEGDALDSVDIAVAEDVPPAVVDTSDDPGLGAIRGLPVA